MSYVEALSDAELWIGEMRGLEIAERRVLLLRTEAGVFAYEDRCAHLGFPLSQGKLEGTVLTCSAHHFQYDVHTGRGINPASARLVPIPLRIEGGKILVDPGPRGGGGSPD